MDKEIAAIATKTGLPWFRYVTFANRPTRERSKAATAPEAGRSLAKVVGALRVQPPATLAGAEGPEGLAVPAPVAVAPFRDLRLQTERPPTRNEDAPTLPPGFLPEARAKATATADFLLLRAIDELRQAHEDVTGHRIHPGNRPSPLDLGKRPAEPAWAGFESSG